MDVKWNLLHNTFVVLIFLQLCALGAYANHDECEQKSSCLCEFSDGTSINLEGLFKPDDTSGKVYLYDTKDNYTIYYHGCVDVKFVIDLDNITNEHCRSPESICVFDAGTRGVEALASASAGQFKRVDSMPDIHALSYSLNGINTMVRLVCTPEFGENNIQIHEVSKDKKQFTLELFSKHACRTSLPHGLSTGSKLLIMFFTFFLVYFIGGACLAYFIRGARGRELIPNVDFWTSLPGLVKDGVVFLVSGCSSRLVTTSETYDQI